MNTIRKEVKRFVRMVLTNVHNIQIFVDIPGIYMI